MRDDQFLFRISFERWGNPFRPYTPPPYCWLCGFETTNGEHVQWFDYGHPDGKWWGCRNMVLVDQPKYLGTISSDPQQLDLF